MCFGIVMTVYTAIGVCCLLMTRLHYSVDVYIALLITSFAYTHSGMKGFFSWLFDTPESVGVNCVSCEIIDESTKCRN